MTSIKIGKDTATLLGVISRGRNITVEDLILEALSQAYGDEVEAARIIIRKSEEDAAEKKEKKS
jgi:hypothetical protein